MATLDGSDWQFNVELLIRDEDGQLRWTSDHGMVFKNRPSAVERYRELTIQNPQTIYRLVEIKEFKP